LLYQLQFFFRTSQAIPKIIGCDAGDRSDIRIRKRAIAATISEPSMALKYQF
jgi:hypothetical protein